MEERRDEVAFVEFLTAAKRAYWMGEQHTLRWRAVFSPHRRVAEPGGGRPRGRADPIDRVSLACPSSCIYIVLEYACEVYFCLSAYSTLYGSPPPSLQYNVASIERELGKPECPLQRRVVPRSIALAKHAVTLGHPLLTLYLFSGAYSIRRA